MAFLVDGTVTIVIQLITDFGRARVDVRVRIVAIAIGHGIAVAILVHHGAGGAVSSQDDLHNRLVRVIGGNLEGICHLPDIVRLEEHRHGGRRAGSQGGGNVHVRGELEGTA